MGTTVFPADVERDRRELSALLASLPPDRLPGIGTTIEALMLGFRMAESRMANNPAT